MVEERLHMIYPNFRSSLSFSTTHADIGLHIKSKSLAELYRVPLASPADRTPFDLRDVKAMTVYDFFHNRDQAGANEMSLREHDHCSHVVNVGTGEYWFRVPQNFDASTP